MMNSQTTLVLACVDGSELTASVVDYAAWVARTVYSPLMLLHNIEHQHRYPVAELSGSLSLSEGEALLEELAGSDHKPSKIIIDQGNLVLAAASQQAQRGGVGAPLTSQGHGSLADSVVGLSADIRVLVLGVRGMGHEHRQALLGAQLEAVVRVMHRPVLVVNRPFNKAPARYLLAYDGSEACGQMLNRAMQSALCRSMTVHLVQVADAGQQERLDDAAALLRSAGLEVVTARLRGDVATQLNTYQQQHDIDLIAMGAFSHGRLHKLLFGSVTRRMLATAQVPLLLLC